MDSSTTEDKRQDLKRLAETVLEIFLSLSPEQRAQFGAFANGNAPIGAPQLDVQMLVNA